MKKILVVEDELVIALAVELVLKEEGYNVVTAADGADGLKMFAGEAPDLVLTDYMMPRMDGLAMIGTLRDNGAKVPIVLATAIPVEKLDSGMPTGYDAYLSKPFTDDDLLAVIRRLLRD